MWMLQGRDYAPKILPLRSIDCGRKKGYILSIIKEEVKWEIIAEDLVAIIAAGSSSCFYVAVVAVTAVAAAAVAVWAVLAVTTAAGSSSCFCVAADAALAADKRAPADVGRRCMK